MLNIASIMCREAHYAFFTTLKFDITLTQVNWKVFMHTNKMNPTSMVEKVGTNSKFEKLVEGLITRKRKYHEDLNIFLRRQANTIAKPTFKVLKNENMACNDASVNSTDIDLIQKLPSTQDQPVAKYTIFARIRDYIPPRICEFSTLICITCGHSIPSPNSRFCTVCNVPIDVDADEGIKYSFRFALLMEGTDGKTIPVIVSDDDAVDLLNLLPGK